VYLYFRLTLTEAIMDDFEIIEQSLEKLSLVTPKTSVSKKFSVQVPSFSSSIIENNRTDGYWVETFHFDDKDRVPGIIA
jgi:aldos-2-ulose dehydratase